MDTLYSGCNNPVIATGVDDLQHAWVGFEASETGTWLGTTHPDLETVIATGSGHSLHADLSASGKNSSVIVCKNHPNTLHPHIVVSSSVHLLCWVAFLCSFWQWGYPTEQQ